MSSSTASRLSAMALLLVLAGAIAATIAVPLAARYRERADAIAESRDQLARLQRIVALTDQRSARLKVIEQRLANSRFLLPQRSSALAAAALQERVKQALDSAGGRLVSSQVLRPKRVGDLDRVGLNVRIAADNEALRAVLAALEGSTPYVVVESLVVVRSRARRRQRRNPAATPAQLLPLDINLTVSGVMAHAGGEESGSG